MDAAGVKVDGDWVLKVVADDDRLWNRFVAKDDQPIATVVAVPPILLTLAGLHVHLEVIWSRSEAERGLDSCVNHGECPVVVGNREVDPPGGIEDHLN